jgi:quinol monooxygenase YgiN
VSPRDVSEFRLVECTDDEQPRRASTLLVDYLLALQPSASLHRVSYLVRPQPGRCDELLQTLCAMAKEIRKEPGCVVCAVCLDDHEGLLLVVSAWKSASDLQAHLRSETSRVLSGSAPLSGGKAEVGFLTSDCPRGGP